jgi:type 1 fimbriae regulatory protein FimB/type 1 fimbriae regulatory protein FimE
LRAAEVCDFRWDQVDFNGAVLHVRRVKNGTPSTHPIQCDELPARRRLHRESPSSPFVFVSKRGSPFTTAGFARMIERVAARLG